ncbi:MAG: hypothetical protein HY079_07905 [Elusimicrobia bacterium]|nr:hypothetical protein [Elusimicrobiota bacterium]
MKIFRWSAVALAVAAGAAVGCSSGGCGGTNINSNSNTPVVTCGPGTAQQGGICVPTHNVNAH